MWLKIVYDEESIAKWPEQPENISVFIDLTISAPVEDGNKSFRVSPIFPLLPDSPVPDITNGQIRFYNFQNAFRVLGQIMNRGSKRLKLSTYFSLGLSSVIVMAPEESAFEEFDRIVDYRPDGIETWPLVEHKIQRTMSYVVPPRSNFNAAEVAVAPYDNLPVTERAVIDEFRIGIILLLQKLTSHMPWEFDKIRKLVGGINELVQELVYLQNPTDAVPKSLSEFSKKELSDDKTKNIIKHQNLDRIIQVNSALSYVSTQAFSGAIPILERRSLIRRHSLLGIGSAILALNNVARFIEQAFTKVDFIATIKEKLIDARPLPGLDKLPNFESAEWRKQSIEILARGDEAERSYFKLPYFSGRLGFRETEYSIAAAIQSISSGASLEYSLMTLTHEMLHGHVRSIFAELFKGTDEMSKGQQKDIFYDAFERLVRKKNRPAETENESIRAIIFTYCCLTTTHGSLTRRKENDSRIPFQFLEKEELWEVFGSENRNINEIFVHILDLHYFYSSSLEVYIPLIWCSWLAVPHVNGDLRQYILRSLITISSTITSDSPVRRFNASVTELTSLLESNRSGQLSHPVIDDVLSILRNSDELWKFYFPAFNASQIVVDLVTSVFYSKKIRASLFNDDYVDWQKEKSGASGDEREFVYTLGNGFYDEVIASPLAYLLDKMVKDLRQHGNLDQIERDTVALFLALISTQQTP